MTNKLNEPTKTYAEAAAIHHHRTGSDWMQLPKRTCPGGVPHYVRGEATRRCGQRFAQEVEGQTQCRDCLALAQAGFYAPTLAEIIATFPATFGLRAFPGETFCISARDSYVSDHPAPDTVYLYTQRQDGDRWLSFAKGTPQELRAEVIALPETQNETKETK